MPNPYSFSWDGESYNFTTDLNVKYRVVFESHGELFQEYPSLNGRVFSFSFFPTYSESLEIRADGRVSDTLADLVHKFFESRTNLVVFVCDHTDGKELCRRRLFERWFTGFNTSSFLEKHNGTLTGIDFDPDTGEQKKKEIYSSIILRADLEDKEHVVLAYEQLKTKLSK